MIRTPLPPLKADESNQSKKDYSCKNLISWQNEEAGFNLTWLTHITTKQEDKLISFRGLIKKQLRNVCLLPGYEVTTGRGAPGHFTPRLCEVVNLAPFVTSFSARLMAPWQLYSRHVLWVVMQRNYIGPNLMNQVNVSPAPLTSLACDLPSLHEGQTEALTLCTAHSFSLKLAQSPTCTCYYSQSRTWCFVMSYCGFVLNDFGTSSVWVNQFNQPATETWCTFL